MAIGSSKYTVYKSPTEALKQDMGLYATSPADIPDGLIGSDFNILSKPINDPVKSNLLNAAPAKSIQAGKKTIFAKSTLTEGQKTGIGVAGMVTDTVGEVADAKKNLAVDEYLTDLEYWKQQGKYWFDKDADYAPTFEEYSPDMPSATDALKEGSMTGSNVADSAIGGAASGALTGAILGGPVGAGVGAIVGGLTGLITGFMAGGAAKSKDAKEKKRMYDEYKTRLKTWTYQKNMRNQQNRIAKEDEITEKSMGIISEGRRIKKAKRATMAAAKNTNKERMLSVLRNMGSSGEEAAHQRKTRWQ